MDITIVTLSPHELINDETRTELLIGQLFEFQVDIFKSTWHEIGIDSNWFTKVVTEAIDLFHWTELNGMHNQVFEQWPPISPPTTWLLLHLIQSASLYVYTPSPAPTPLHSRAVGCPDPPSIRTHLSYIHCFLLSLLFFFVCVLSFAFYLFRVTRLSSILSTRVALNSFFFFGSCFVMGGVLCHLVGKFGPDPPLCCSITIESVSITRHWSLILDGVPLKMWKLIRKKKNPNWWNAEPSWFQLVSLSRSTCLTATWKNQKGKRRRRRTRRKRKRKRRREILSICLGRHQVFNISMRVPADVTVALCLRHIVKATSSPTSWRPPGSPPPPPPPLLPPPTPFLRRSKSDLCCVGLIFFLFRETWKSSESDALPRSNYHFHLIAVWIRWIIFFYVMTAVRLLLHWICKWVVQVS